MRLLILLFFPILALAMPCPNGQGILYRGDSVTEAIRQCGKPTKMTTNKQTLSSIEQLIYYRNQPYNYGNLQMVAIIENNRVSRITITQYYPAYVCQQAVLQYGAVTTVQTGCGTTTTNTAITNFCGYNFGIGASIEDVLSICGPPASRSELQRNTQEETRLYYEDEAIIFRNDKLVDWQ